MMDISKFNEISDTSSKIRGRRKKSLSWKKKDQDEEEDSATQECLLPRENSVGLLLVMSIIIAIVQPVLKEMKRINNDYILD